MSMDDVVLRLAQVRSATAGLLDWLEQLRFTDEDVRQPSLLPGWTRAHVLAHIAQNADGISRTLDGVLRSEVVKRYPGGMDARDDAIEAGADDVASKPYDPRHLIKMVEQVLKSIPE